MNDLVTIDSGGQVGQMPPPPPPPPVDETGFEGLVNLKPGTLKLVQPTTNDPGNARIGQYKDTLTGDVLDTFEAVIMKIGKTRVYFPPGSDFTSAVEPLCRSNDGVRPEDGVKSKQANSCDRCSKASWAHGKPECKENRAMLLVRTDNIAPYYMNATGLSVSTLNAGLQPMLMKIREASQKAEYINSHHFAITFGAKKGPKGPTHVIDIKKIRRLPKEEAQKFIDIFEQGKAQASQRQQEDSADAVIGDVIDAEVVEVQMQAI